MSIRFLVALAVLLTLAQGRALGQSLADVARQEEARRKNITTPSKVLTNEDLRHAGVPEPPSGSEQKPAQTQPSTPPGGASTPPANAPQEPAKEPAKDQAYWRGRITEARDQLDRTKTFMEAVQNRINSLTTDYVNRDDPAQRAVLERERQKNVAELERLKKEIQQQTKAIADIEEEARRAGVPPGWLR